MHTGKLLADLLERIAEVMLGLRFRLLGGVVGLFNLALLGSHSGTRGVRGRGVLQRLLGALDVLVLRRRREGRLQILRYAKEVQGELSIRRATRQDRAAC